MKIRLVRTELLHANGRTDKSKLIVTLFMQFLWKCLIKHLEISVWLGRVRQTVTQRTAAYC